MSTTQIRTKEIVDKWRRTLIERYGKVAWNKGLTKDNNQFMKKQAETKKGKRCTPQTEFKKGHDVSAEVRKKMSENWDYEKHHTDKIREKRSRSMKNRWKDENYRNSVIKLQRKHVSPTSPEKILISIIERNDLPFNFVGNGTINFKGENHSFNPDFLSKNPKHIIEVFGDYWHGLHEHRLKDKERLETYLRYGYKTLVLWQHELKSNRFGKQLSEQEIVSKIREFIN